MTRAEECKRSEDQYLDLVDFITNHPNTPITIGTYLAWPHRNQGIDWGVATPEAVAQRVASRMEHLAHAVLLPQRPDKVAPSRNTVWLQEMVRAGGAFYRVKRGVYILDTAASWRGTGAGVVLRDNRWPHHPPARVHEAMPAHAAVKQPPQAPEPPEPVVTAASEPVQARTFAPPVAAMAAPNYSVEAAGVLVGDQIVLRRTDVDGTQVLLLAKVSSVIQAVAT